MPTLFDTLSQLTWRNLRATAHAHGLPFNTNLTKNDALLWLHHELMTGGQLRRSFRQLQDAERAALTSLQAAGGTLPLHTFTKRFGVIRPYRPWRNDHDQRYPWRHPVSPAEKLWFLGFISICSDTPHHLPRVKVPDEVLALLSPLPRPKQVNLPPHPATYNPVDLLVDMAAMIGSLGGMAVKPRWHRWFPVHALKQINRRLRHREDLTGIRSERSTGRLRLLHYLAHVGDLLVFQQNAILPTVYAWEWLERPPSAQWHHLWTAWQTDLERRSSDWEAFGFPHLPFAVWSNLLSILGDMEAGKSYSSDSLIEALHPHVSEADILENIPEVLEGPLTWAGIIRVGHGTLSINHAGRTIAFGTPPVIDEFPLVQLIIGQNTLRIAPGHQQTLRVFAELCSWSTIEEQGDFVVDESAIARAVTLGYDALQVSRVLQSIIGRPLSSDEYDLIRGWEIGSNKLQLRHMVVLTAKDADVLGKLRHDQRLRACFSESLSPHHAAVRPHALPALQQSLNRRGYAMSNSHTAPPLTTAGSLDYPQAEYLWLAVNTYRRLATLIDLPLRIPASLLDWLSGTLPPDRRSTLAQTTDALIEALMYTMEGQAALPSPVAQIDPESVRNAVDNAYQQRTPVKVQYFSAAYGFPTTRMLEPVSPIIETDGTAYFDAWCQTTNTTRTFRLDRVICVIEP